MENIAEILKNCPKGTKLYSPVFGEVTLDRTTSLSIVIRDLSTQLHHLYTNGKLYPKGECLLFPSKENRDWDKFSPFKDGDIAISEKNDIHLLRTSDSSYCAFRESWNNKFDPSITTNIKIVRFATEAEKQKLFDAIKADGYKWNPKTKTLEELIEPKFKVGDRIRHKTHIRQGNAVTEIKDTYYILDDELALPFTSQDGYELVPNKFNISTLVPLESRVLVRNVGNWKPAVWGYYSKGYAHPFVVDGGNTFAQCIPYEGNEHLLGTTNDCDEYFKTW